MAEPPAACTTEVREHLAFLHAATVRIGGGLEPDQVVGALCDMTVPRVADLATAYLYDAVLSEGRLPETPAAAVLRRAALAGHARPPGGLAARVPVAELTGPFAVAIATGQLVAWPGPGGLGELREIGEFGRVLASGRPGSLLAVPLRTDERVLGLAVLLRGAGRAPFDETDVLTASLMADQAALGVHKALLYRREARIADTLQRSMLPGPPPRIPGVEIAYRYLPGNPAARVGGDWFDAIPLPGSRVALVVGDVMGHGVRSAATMGRLRTAVRTLAVVDPPPDQVLHHLDRLFHDAVGQSDEHHLATCVYCVYDPVTGRCALANAGHVPPVLVRPDGSAELVELPSGMPLGVGNVAFQTVEMTMPDGGLIALCTDGLVESRERGLTEGLAALRSCLADPGGSPDDLCDEVLAAMRGARCEDDVALLIARFDRIPSASVANWLMRPHPRTPGNARRLIAATLDDWGLAEHVDVAQLLATELVTNAIRYTTRPISLRLQRTGNLLCEVGDDDRNLPVLREPGDGDEGGRGVYLIDRIAERWGCGHTATGKAVWFELPL